MKNKKKTQKQKEKKKKEWYKSKINTYIYVKGLPEDVSLEEIETFFSKAGVFRLEKKTNLPKIKIYKDEHNVCKGDALICYAKPESIQISKDLLSDREIRSGFKIRIEDVNTFNKIKETKLNSLMDKQ